MQTTPKTTFKTIQKMFQKFIINQDGVLRFGNVYLHRDMLKADELCIYGGGLWKIDHQRGAVRLRTARLRFRQAS